MSVHRKFASTVFFLCVSVLRAEAHHSYGAFDTSREQQVRGTVLDFDWTGPHTTTTVEVGSQGEAVIWQFEGMSPDYLGRRGWNRQTLVPGDAVTIDYYPRKDGKSGGLLIRLTQADGTVRVMIVVE